MTYSVLRWYHLRKKNLWNTYFHLSKSHCLSARAVFAGLKCYHQIDSLLQKHGSFSTWQCFYFSSWLFPTWISALSGAWLHISARFHALHIKLSIALLGFTHGHFTWPWKSWPRRDLSKSRCCHHNTKLLDLFYSKWKISIQIRDPGGFRMANLAPSYKGHSNENV